MWTYSHLCTFLRIQVLCSRRNLPTKKCQIKNNKLPSFHTTRIHRTAIFQVKLLVPKFALQSAFAGIQIWHPSLAGLQNSRHMALFASPQDATDESMFRRILASSHPCHMLWVCLSSYNMRTILASGIGVSVFVSVFTMEFETD